MTKIVYSMTLRKRDSNTTNYNPNIHGTMFGFGRVDRLGWIDRLEKVNRFRWVLDKLGGVSSNREIDHDTYT